MPHLPNAAPPLALLLAVAQTACGTNPGPGLDLDAGPAGSDAPDVAREAGVSDAEQPDADDAGRPQDVRADGVDADTPGPILWPEGCTAPETWTIADRPQWNDPAFFGFSPDDGQVWLVHHGSWDGAAARVSDGALLARPGSGGVVDLDAVWNRVAWMELGDRAEVVVRSLGVGEVLRVDVGNPLDGSRAAVALHPDGDVVAWASCATPVNGDATLRIGRRAIAPGASTLADTVRIDEASCYGYDDRTLLRWVGDDLWVLPGLSGDVWIFPRDGDPVGPLPLAPGPVDPLTGRGPGVVELLAEPGAGGVLVTTTDGSLLRYARPVPDQGAAIAETAAGTLNGFTFAPKVQVAPMAIDRGGRFLAWASGPTEVTVGTLDGRPIARFPLQIPPDDLGVPPSEDRVARIAFSGDSDGLAIASTGAIHYIGCPGEIPGAAPASVQVELVGRPRVGQLSPVRVRTEGGGPWTVLRATAAGQPVPTPLFAAELPWYPQQAGAVALEVSAANALGEARAALTVEVAAP